MAGLLLALAPALLVGSAALTFAGCGDEAENAALAQDGDDTDVAVARALVRSRGASEGDAPDGVGGGWGSRVIVVLGSSTSAGVGASNWSNQWVERYRAFLRQNYSDFQLHVLAQGGFTTYEIQPSWYTPPANRPRPNTGKNINAALALNPGAIILNMPSNDQQGYYSLDEQMANYNRIAQICAENGIQLWVSTSQPRNFGDANQRNELMRVRDAIRGRFGDHTLDFWTGIANGDGTINGAYNSGDGVHLNDNGHRVLAERAQWAQIPKAVRGW